MPSQTHPSNSNNLLPDMNGLNNYQNMTNSGGLNLLGGFTPIKN